MGLVDDLKKALPGLDFSIPYGPQLWRALRNWPAEKIAQWNLLWRWSAFPCDELTWWIYVETALPALGEFVLALVAFDWDDIARGYLRPVGFRSRAALVEGIGAKFRKRFEIPELGEVIGARLPGAKIVKRFTAHPVTRALFKIDAFLQRGLFYWMLLDITQDFFYNWAVGLFHTEVCAQSGYGASYCDDQLEASYIFTNNNWLTYQWAGYQGRVWRKTPYVSDELYRIWGSDIQDVYVCGIRKYRLAYPPQASTSLELQIRTDDGIVLDYIKGVPPYTYGCVVATIPRGKRARMYWRVVSNIYPVRVYAGPTMIQGWGLGFEQGG